MSAPAHLPWSLPDEELFWERYAPRREVHFSLIISIVLHAIAVYLLLGIFGVSNVVKYGNDTGPIPLGLVRLIPEDKDIVLDDLPDKLDKAPEKKLMTFDQLRKRDILQELGDDACIRDWLEQSSSSFTKVVNLEPKARVVLRKCTSSFGVPTDSQPSLREKRILRWAFRFNTDSGAEYRSQLAGLGAMIAIPVAGQEGKFLLIRNLDNPVPREEDVTKLGLMYWIDNKPETVRLLVSELKGLHGPPYFVAFFPLKVEKRLHGLEAEYALRRHGIRDEDSIHETIFDVVRAEGGYDLRLRDLYLRRNVKLERP